MAKEIVAQLPLGCGEFTCARKRGEFCRFMRTMHFGTVWVCGIFDKKPDEVAGWLMRLPECLRATGDAPKKEAA